MACGAKTPDACGPYEGLGAVWEQCLVREAPKAASVEAARCAEAGRAEEDCRVAWVQSHRREPVDLLLAACQSADCRLVALDYHPSPLDEQIPRCETLGLLASSCVLHALVRAYGDDAAPRPAPGLPTEGSRWLGLAAREAGQARTCGHDIDCTFFGSMAPACLAPAAAQVDCNSYRPSFPLPPTPAESASQASP
jgi:hypothetical protein